MRLKKGKKKRRSSTIERADDMDNTIKFEVFCDEEKMEVRSNEKLMPITEHDTGKGTMEEKENGSTSVEFQINPSDKTRPKLEAPTNFVFDVFDSSRAEGSVQIPRARMRKKTSQFSQGGKRNASKVGKGISRRRTINGIPSEEVPSSRTKKSYRRSLPLSRSHLPSVPFRSSGTHKVLFNTFKLLLGVLGLSWLLAKIYAPVLEIVRRK